MSPTSPPLRRKWRILLLLSLAELLGMAVWFSAFLALGPAAGIKAMQLLKATPASARLAAGRG